jgi:hypothetical protein
MGPIEILAVMLFLLGCYALAIGIMQLAGFVPLKVSRDFRFLGASGLGNIAGGLGALTLSVAFPLGVVIGRSMLLVVVAGALGLVGLSFYLSERRRSARPGTRR